VVARAAATQLQRGSNTSYSCSLIFLHGPKARADPFGLRRMPQQVQLAQQSAWLLPRDRLRGCLGGPAATNQRHCLQLVRSPLHLVHG
jgi:hypothetical protein